MENVFKAFFEKKIDEIHFGGLFLNFMEMLVTLVVENYLKASFFLNIVRYYYNQKFRKSRRTPLEKKH